MTVPEPMTQSRIESELPLALAAGQLFCVYQPQVELTSGRLHAFETLVRWQHPRHGVVTPNRILPAVAATGSEAELFATVLDEALRAQRGWSDAWGSRPAVAVNLSAAELTGTDVVDTVLRVLAGHTAPASSLWLEVAEAALTHDAMLETLRSLQDVGVNLALDDFGSGGAPMSRSLHFPWDLLKIDRSFLDGLGEDPVVDRPYRSMITLAGGLGIRTLAEGVETADQLARISDLGCDLAQGFFLGHPLSADVATTHVDSSGRWVGAPATIDRDAPFRRRSAS
jgi:EAL domain-containing protein (putative c-di-GMP-specific phosphodiesterase class I)